METLFRDCTTAELDAFLSAYPRKLERDVATMCEPPMTTWNDFERAPRWPESVVAKWSGERCQVLRDIKAPPPDNGKRDAEQPLFDSQGREVKEGDTIIAKWGWGSHIPDQAHPSDENDIYTPTASGFDHFRRSKVLIRDKGTSHAYWSFDDCHNYLRGFDFRVEDA
jgi:hypothetical protein